MAPSINNILVIGASGNIGPYIVAALIAANFNVSVLTRTGSSAVFAPGVTVHQTDYSTLSLTTAFKGMDAIISTVPWFSATLQISVIDCAMAAGVKRYIPSAFGIDDASPRVLDYVPIIRAKVETREYLQSKEGNGLTWTSLTVGSFFDWAFTIPTVMGWNLPARQATIFDGGDVEYEATTMPHIGRAVVAILSPENFEKTANTFVYVNSFTLTQKMVLATLEKLTGDKFEVIHSTAKSITDDGIAAYDSGKARIGDQGLETANASGNIITGAFYGNGNLNNYSRSPGLWNERLGLPQEDIETTLRAVLKLKSDLV